MRKSGDARLREEAAGEGHESALEDAESARFIASAGEEFDVCEAEEGCIASAGGGSEVGDVDVDGTRSSRPTVGCGEAGAVARVSVPGRRCS